MICSMKQSVMTTIKWLVFFSEKGLLGCLDASLCMTALIKKKGGLNLRAQRDSFKCEAYEAADQSKLVEPEVKVEAA
jgi:hypothetical protein